MVDVAVVGYGQMPSVRSTEITETQMVLEVTHQAVAMAGIDRHDIGFTVSGSCDYLAGQTFAFVQTIEAIGAWPRCGARRRSATPKTSQLAAGAAPTAASRAGCPRANRTET